jgi:hypothetical protein
MSRVIHYHSGIRSGLLGGERNNGSWPLGFDAHTLPLSQVGKQRYARCLVQKPWSAAQFIKKCGRAGAGPIPSGAPRRYRLDDRNRGGGADISEGGREGVGVCARRSERGSWRGPGGGGYCRGGRGSSDWGCWAVGSTSPIPLQTSQRRWPVPPHSSHALPLP